MLKPSFFHARAGCWGAVEGERLAADWQLAAGACGRVWTEGDAQRALPRQPVLSSWA